MRRGIAIDRHRLRRLRLEKIGTRELLAVQAGLSVSAIALYETGRRLPLPETLERLAAALRIDPTELAP